MKTFHSFGGLRDHLFGPRKRKTEPHVRGTVAMLVPTWRLYELSDLPIDDLDAMEAVKNGFFVEIDENTKRSDLDALELEPNDLEDC